MYSRTADYYLTFVIDFNVLLLYGGQLRSGTAVSHHIRLTVLLETFVILKIAVVNFYHIFEQ